MSTVRAPLTTHAKMRRKQMSVTEHQIDLVLSDPDTVYPAKGGATNYQRGHLVVVLSSENAVITILWHRKEGR